MQGTSIPDQNGNSADEAAGQESIALTFEECQEIRSLPLAACNTPTSLIYLKASCSRLCSCCSESVNHRQVFTSSESITQIGFLERDCAVWLVVIGVMYRTDNQSPSHQSGIKCPTPATCITSAPGMLPVLHLLS